MGRGRGEVGGALVGVVGHLEQRRTASGDAANERLAVGDRGRWGPVGEGRGVPLVLLKAPQETQSTPAQQTAPPPGLRRLPG